MSSSENIPQVHHVIESQPKTLPVQDRRLTRRSFLKNLGVAAVGPQLLKDVTRPEQPRGDRHPFNFRRSLEQLFQPEISADSKQIARYLNTLGIRISAKDIDTRSFPELDPITQQFFYTSLYLPGLLENWEQFQPAFHASIRKLMVMSYDISATQVNPSPSSLGKGSFDINVFIRPDSPLGAANEASHILVALDDLKKQIPETYPIFAEGISNAFEGATLAAQLDPELRQLLPPEIQTSPANRSTVAEYYQNFQKSMERGTISTTPGGEHTQELVQHLSTFRQALGMLSGINRASGGFFHYFTESLGAAVTQQIRVEAAGDEMAALKAHLELATGIVGGKGEYGELASQALSKLQEQQLLPELSLGEAAHLENKTYHLSLLDSKITPLYLDGVLTEGLYFPMFTAIHQDGSLSLPLSHAIWLDEISVNGEVIQEPSYHKVREQNSQFIDLFVPLESLGKEIQPGDQIQIRTRILEEKFAFSFTLGRNITDTLPPQRIDKSAQEKSPQRNLPEHTEF